jgi:hypothetical protein
MGSSKTRHGKRTVHLKLSQVEPEPELESESESSLPPEPLTAASIASASESTTGTHSTASRAKSSPSLNGDIESDLESVSLKPIKKRRRIGRKQKNTVEDREEEQEEMPKKPKSVCFFAHATKMFSFVVPPEVVLLIPEVASDCIQRVSLDSDTSFDAVLQVVYETLPCIGVQRKPQLSYKLSSAPAKALAVRLANEDDWIGCLDTVTEAESLKKKRVGQTPTIPISIIIPDDVSCCYE